MHSKSIISGEHEASILVVSSDAKGTPLICEEGLSFWGGVDPKSGKIIDTYHSQYGQLVRDRILIMPSSRGSCSGSGVLLELAIKGMAPSALIFKEKEDTLTLGVIVANYLFNCNLPIIRLCKKVYDVVAKSKSVQIKGKNLLADNFKFELEVPKEKELQLSDQEKKMLSGFHGEAVQLAMKILCKMAIAKQAKEFVVVTRVHIDGCILASESNLIFAEKMANMGAKVSVPTTTNAISIDLDNFQAKSKHSDFDLAAKRLADAYLEMGALPSFTCAPYQSDDRPCAGENIGWSESNAVIYANSVLGARTAKHPDFLDLFVALTGRAPLSDLYVDQNRKPDDIIHVDAFNKYDDTFWPMLGWLAGKKTPSSVPLLKGLEKQKPSPDNLRALCASFGTTSNAAMLHLAGVTLESKMQVKPNAKHYRITKNDFIQVWDTFNVGPTNIQLIALGSPHLSLQELQEFLFWMDGNQCSPNVKVMVTIGRDTKKQASATGMLNILEKLGIEVISDLCWCSITEPTFPSKVKTVITNSGKYAHYGPALSGREVRFGGLKECAEVAKSGYWKNQLPSWLID